MVKVLDYNVEVAEFHGDSSPVVRWSYFKSLREARSYFRTCVKYWEGIQFVSDSSHIVIRLIKVLEKDKVEIIDDYDKYF